jgi:hypothetical protein
MKKREGISYDTSSHPVAAFEVQSLKGCTCHYEVIGEYVCKLTSPSCLKCGSRTQWPHQPARLVDACRTIASGKGSRR